MTARALAIDLNDVVQNRVDSGGGILPRYHFPAFAVGIVLWLLMFATQAIIAIGLTQKLGIPIGLGLFACLISMTTGIAGYLLHYSITDKITWRNRIAGLFLPWSLLAGRDSLSWLLLKNVLASLTWGAVMVASYRLSWPMQSIPDSPIPASASTSAVIWVTILCRVALLGGWVLLIRSKLNHHWQQTSIKSTWQPLVIAPLAIISSLMLASYGYTWLALLAVGLPLSGSR